MCQTIQFYVGGMGTALPSRIGQLSCVDTGHMTIRVFLKGHFVKEKNVHPTT